MYNYIRFNFNINYSNLNVTYIQIIKIHKNAYIRKIVSLVIWMPVQTTNVNIFWNLVLNVINFKCWFIAHVEFKLV